MTQYIHNLILHYSVETDSPDPSNFTADLLRAGVQKRIEDLDSEGDIAWTDSASHWYDPVTDMVRVPNEGE